MRHLNIIHEMMIIISFNSFYFTKYFTQISTFRENFGHKTCFIA